MSLKDSRGERQGPGTLTRLRFRAAATPAGLAPLPPSARGGKLPEGQWGRSAPRERRTERTRSAGNWDGGAARTEAGSARCQSGRASQGPRSEFSRRIQGAWRVRRMCRSTGTLQLAIGGALVAGRAPPYTRACAERREGGVWRAGLARPLARTLVEEGAGGRAGGGGLSGLAILVKIFKMADGGAASQDESSAAAAAAAGNHYGILHIHIHTRAAAPPT